MQRREVECDLARWPRDAAKLPVRRVRRLPLARAGDVVGRRARAIEGDGVRVRRFQYPGARHPSDGAIAGGRWIARFASAFGYRRASSAGFHDDLGWIAVGLLLPDRPHRT